MIILVNCAAKKIIKFYTFHAYLLADIPYINATAEKDLEIKSRLDFADPNDGMFMRLCVKFIPHINLEQLQLNIMQNPAFLIPKSNFFYNDLQAHEKQSFETEIYLSESEAGEIFSSEVAIVVTFINKQSIARILRHAIEVPLRNVVKVVQPQKDGIFKVTLTSSPIVDISVLFSGMEIKEQGSN